MAPPAQTPFRFINRIFRISPNVCNVNFYFAIIPNVFPIASSWCSVCFKLLSFSFKFVRCTNTHICVVGALNRVGCLSAGFPLKILENAHISFRFIQANVLSHLMAVSLLRRPFHLAPYTMHANEYSFSLAKLFMRTQTHTDCRKTNKMW